MRIVSSGDIMIAVLFILIFESYRLRKEIERLSYMLDGYLVGRGEDAIMLEYPIWGIIPISRLYFSKSDWDSLEFIREYELENLQDIYINKAVRDNEQRINLN